MSDETPPTTKGQTAVESWQRPPFEPGNFASVKHGARSDRLVEPRARELVAEVFEANAHLDEVRDAPGVRRYCMTLSRIERVYHWLAQQDDSVFSSELRASRASKDPSPHGVWERLERWERQADQAEERLGISPVSRARLQALLNPQGRSGLGSFINGTAAEEGGR